MVDKATTATRIPFLPGKAKAVQATAYLVIELPNHDAYPVGKEAIVERARELAAEGKMPVRWVDPDEVIG